uniref:Uncharacterized protein n=1 Tax=Lactuca sativa TaxID=4236 RepID=A0A9R1WKM6_LACSA|nr:hypothetical protein LSAT_V11C200060780 [Lactuca sativa]
MISYCLVCVLDENTTISLICNEKKLTKGLSPVPQKIPNFSGEEDGYHGRFEDKEVKLFVESFQSDPWYFFLTCDRFLSIILATMVFLCIYWHGLLP